MLLESVGSTSKRVEELLNNINENKINLDGSFHIKDHFTGSISYQISDFNFASLCFFLWGFV